ncbi:MAG TPA: hypothetical protein VGX91_04710 [Candidatus Cybelea sp.]|jgi:hypothetical protein|nr:hypothetical protein [Candidatus Cybelea sp.]
MRLPFRSLLSFVLAAAAAALGAGSAGAAPGPVRIAIDRCNSQAADAAYARIRDYERHAPGNTPTAMIQRLAQIADVLSLLAEEHGILESICSSDAARAPLFTEIAATVSWALVLESDIAAKLNASCPAAEKALPTIMLADAWLSMANVVRDGNGTVPPLFNDVIAKVQTRAAAVGLTLPNWPDSTSYWRDTVRDKAKVAVATCPSPSPGASPSPSALPTPIP